MKKVYYIAVFILFLMCGCVKTPESTDNNIEDALLEKAQRVGIYLAAARQAEREGKSEASVYLGEIAEEEIEHLRDLSSIQADIGRNTKKSLKIILKIEKYSARNLYPMISRVARDENKTEIVEVLSKMAEDEKRHYSGLKGLLKKIK